jgi:hypothetical protein
MLAPPFDTKEKDLGGSILAEGEKEPVGATNEPPASMALNTNGAEEPPGGGPDAGRLASRGMEDLSDLRSLLDQYDGDHDGKLTPEELAALVAKLPSGLGGAGVGSSLANMQDLMELFDTNNDGKVDANELAAGMRKLTARHANRGALPTAPALN